MKKILIVDDCKVTVQTLRSMLIKQGYDVDYVHDGEAGLARVKNWNPDLLILDVIMPGMDGLTSLYRIRSDAKYKHLPVIIHTSKGNMKDLFEDKNIKAFIEKPFDEEKLLQIIRSALL